MIAKALYFPYIRIPENQWFVRALLYWDQVGSIVPFEYVNKPEVLGPYMVSLLNSGLVTQVLPSNYIGDLHSFKSAFIDLVEAKNLPTIIHSTQKRSQEWFKVHVEKLGDLPDELVWRGLARRSNYPWYELESTTADLFMAYLAGVLSQVGDEPFIPITDNVSFLNPFVPGSSESHINDRLGRAQAVILEHILPAPKGKIDPFELARFKDKHQSLLRQFRLHLESSVLNIAAIHDNEARIKVTADTIARMKEEIDEISTKMVEHRWTKIDIGTIFGIFASAIPGYKAVMTGSMADAAAAGFGVLAAIYTAVSSTRHRRNLIEAKPLAYSALVKGLVDPCEQS